MANGLVINLNQEGPIPLAVNIEVAPGETLALVGPSGAGKTTILRSIAGLYRPQGGQIVCDAEPWFDSGRHIDLPARERRVGLVFQSYALFPHMTALGNVAEAMLEHSSGDRRNRATALLSRVHMDGYADRLPSELSGGQQQRIALARALARDPHVLLLDEPFSAVDRPTRRALQVLLTEIRASSDMPIVIVSHDIEDAARSASRICYLRFGQSVEQGFTRAMLNNPEGELVRWLHGIE